MGGFLSALGNITSGAGAAAAEYSKQQRDLFHQTKMEGLRQMLDLINKHTPDSAEFQTGAGLINKVANAQPGDENNHTLLGQFMKWVHPHPNTIQAMQQAGVPGAGPAPPPTKAPPGPATAGAQPGAAQFNFNGEPYLKASPDGVTAGGAAQAGSNPLTSPQAPSPIPPVNDPGSTATMSVSPGGPMTMAPPQPVEPAQPAAPPQQPVESYDDWARAHLPADLRSHYGGNSDIYNSRIHQELEKYTPQRSEMERMQAMHKYQLEVAGPAIIKQLHDTGALAGMSPMQRSQATFQALTGKALPTTPIGYFREEKTKLDADRMTTEQKAAYGLPPDAKGPYWGYRDPQTHEVVRPSEPVPVNERLFWDQFNNGYFAPALAGAVAPSPAGGNAVPPTMLQQRDMGVGPGNHKLFASLEDLKFGRAPSVSPGQVASTLPTVSSTTPNIEGGVDRVSRRQAPPANGGQTVPAGGGTSPGVPGSPTPRKAGDRVRLMAEHVVDGSESFDKLKEGQKEPVREYIEQHGMQFPAALTGKGLEAVTRIDSVNEQIDGLLERFQNLPPNTSLMKDYLKYSAGYSTSYDDIFSGTAFERLRSASAALAGTNSRAYPVLKEGLVHTPTFDRARGLLPDEVKLMVNKLSEAKKLLQIERRTTVRDSHKTGVIGPVVEGADATGGSASPAKRRPSLDSFHGNR